MSRNPARDETAIAGVGHAGCYRDAGVSMGVLALRACKLAVEDAGLTLQDVDGFCTTSGGGARGMSTTTGWSDIDSRYMIEALGLPGVRFYHDRPLGGVPGVGSAALATLAVASGQCDVALACRINYRPKKTGYGHSTQLRSGGVDAFFDPYGYGVFHQKFSAWFQRYRYQYGVTREQLATYVLQSRENYLRGDVPGVAPKVPMTMDDYMNARWVSEPLSILDCDYPCDGAAAVVVTTAERARDLKQKPVYVSAVGAGTGPRPDFVYWHDYTEMAAHYAAKDIWDRAGLTPKDMDLAQIYDGFSPFIFYWLDALGFSTPKDVGEFVGGGALKPNGVLPTNLNGGQLNEGRLHCLGHTIEAVKQLRGQSNERQLEKANAAVVAGGGLAVAVVMVLHT